MKTDCAEFALATAKATLELPNPVAWRIIDESVRAAGMKTDADGLGAAPPVEAQGVR